MEALHTRIFEYRSVAPTTRERLLAFYNHPSVLRTLTPPPIFVQIVRDNMTSLTQGEREFILWFGPLPVRWIARHEPGPTEDSFIDRMVQGPAAYWEHQHLLRDVPGGVEVTDRITLAHRPSGFWSVFTRLFFDGLPLRLLFFYRHLRTRWALSGTREPKSEPAAK